MRARPLDRDALASPAVRTRVFFFGHLPACRSRSPSFLAVPTRTTREVDVYIYTVSSCLHTPRAAVALDADAGAGTRLDAAVGATASFVAPLLAAMELSGSAHLRDACNSDYPTNPTCNYTAWPNASFAGNSPAPAPDPLPPQDCMCGAAWVETRAQARRARRSSFVFFFVCSHRPVGWGAALTAAGRRNQCVWVRVRRLCGSQ